MKEKTLYIFSAVISLFAVCLLVLSLMTSVKTAEVNDRAAELEKSLCALRAENERLETKTEMRISLEEIEREAVEKLGMQRVRPEQVVVLETVG